MRVLTITLRGSSLPPGARAMPAAIVRRTDTGFSYDRTIGAVMPP